MKWLLLTISLFSFTAMAQDTEYSFKGRNYSISYKLEEDHQIIHLDGHLYSGVIENLKGYKHVQEILKQDVDITVVINSGGGYQKLYNKLAASLKKACNSEETNCRITTEVPYGKFCSSACIPFFMTGDIRRANAHSFFGFHQAAVIPGVFKLKGYAERDLLKNGVDPTWLEMNKHLFDSINMIHLYPPKMHGSNIVTEIIN